MGGGKITWPFRFIWSAKVPPTAKIFAYLLLQDRVLTRDILRKRGIHTEMVCVNCANCPVESVLHLAFLCPFATAVMKLVSSITTVREAHFRIDTSVQGVWIRSWDMVRAQGQYKKKEWTSRFICAIWNVWKRRNGVIFREEHIPAETLAIRIAHEMDLWLSNC